MTISGSRTGAGTSGADHATVALADHHGGRPRAADRVEVGQMELARFSNPGGLMAIGGIRDYHQAKLKAADAAETATWWDGQLFDRILLDAPCSATGVIRRHPDIKLLRRPSDIDKLVALQRRMLDALWPTLKPGGLLLYATCSVLPEENDLGVHAFINATADAHCQPIEASWGTARSCGRQLRD